MSPQPPPLPLPLDGITVVAVEQAVSAPFATRQLADLGARVIKVERPDGGDFARGYDTAARGLASHFVWCNRGKESIAVDLKDPRGLDIVHRLVAGADVFVQNLAQGAAARLGLDAAALCEAHPRLVAVDISGYGSGGPYAHKRAYDMLVQCEAGLVSVTGTAEEPVKAGVPAADIAAAMYAFSGVLAALLRRGTTGRGGVVEISMLEALAEWMGHPLHHGMHGGESPAARGSRMPSSPRTTPIRPPTAVRCCCPCRTTASGGGSPNRSWAGRNWPSTPTSRPTGHARRTVSGRTRRWPRPWQGWTRRTRWHGWRRRGSPAHG
jgi:crotonobetainyl-CoA:carnitine CoA-transferase CaiB-like acyl-CoA transferase